MNDEIFFDGRRYISATEASSASGLSRDYVGKLCRDGKVQSKRIGKNWYVDDSAFKTFLVNREFEKEVARKSLAQSRVLEYHGGKVPMPAPIIAAESSAENIGISAHTSSFFKSASPRRARVQMPELSHFEKASAFAGAAVVESGISEKASSFASTPGITDALRTSLQNSVSLPSGITIPVTHMPIHTITPFVEMAHKLIALTLALMLTFGTYAIVDHRFSEYAIGSIRDTGHSVVLAYEKSAGSIAAVSVGSQSVLAYVAAHPNSVAAAAGNVFTLSLPRVLARFAQGLNSGFDSAIYAITLTPKLFNTNFTLSNGSVAVEVKPYETSHLFPQAIPASAASLASGSNTGGNVTNIINQPVIERIITADSIAASGGISAAYLDDRLTELDNKLSSRLYSFATANSTAIAQNYNVVAQTSAINNLTNTAMGNPTITGGSISGATISALSLTVSGASNLKDTAVNGSLTVGGSVTLSGTSTISAPNASFTSATSTSAYAGNFTADNGTITNATSTNAYAVNFNAINATSTNLFATTASSTNLFAATANLGSTTIASLSIGSAYFSGGLGIGVATTSAGVLQTQSDAWIGGNLYVGGNSTVIGNSTSNLLTINSAINSHLVPNGNKIFDLGSASYFWRNAYIDTLNVNNISAASSSIGGTNSQTFTINAGNGTTDTQDMNLIFYRGTIVPNAVFSWNSALSAKRFELNQPLYISNLSASTTAPTLTIKGTAGQTANILQIASSTGTSMLTIGPDGALSVSGFTSYASSTIGNGTQAGGLTISGGATTTGNAYFAGNVGIGTTTPRALLHVSGGNILLDDLKNISFINSAGTILPMVALDASNNLAVGTRSSSFANVNLNAGTASVINFSAGSVLNAMTLDTTGKFGIGTTTPYGILSISNSATTAANTPLFTIASTTGGTATTTLFSVSSAGQTIIGGGSAGTGYAATVNTNSPNASALDVNGQSFFNGVVYLAGTVAQAVNGNAASSWSLAGITASASAPTLIPNKADTTTGIGGNTGELSLITNSLERLKITSGGNVGVGTTSPFAKFAIHANNGETNTRLFEIASSTASATTTLFSVSNTGFITTPGGTFSNTGDFRVNGSLYASAGGGIQFAGRTQLASGVDGLLALYNNAGTDFSRLQFGGTTSAFPAIKRNGAGIDFRLADDSAYASTTFSLFNALGTTGTSTIAAGQGFTVGSSQLVVQQGSGAVGVGTASPVTTLDVNGTMRVSSWLSGSGNLSMYGNVSSTLGMLLSTGGNLSINGVTGTTSIATGQGFTIGSSQFVMQQGSGFVGIGTASPASALHVIGSGTFSSGVSAGGTVAAPNVNASIYMWTPTVYGSLAASGNLTLDSTFSGTKGNVIVAPSGGNVGIGTTTPFGKFALSLNNGETYTGNNAFIIASSTASATTTLFSVSNTGNTIISGISTGKVDIGQLTDVGSYAGIGFNQTSLNTVNAALWGNGVTTILNGITNQNIAFNLGNFSQMNLTTTGLGIGTTTPWAKLHIVGSSSTTGNAFEIGNSASTTILTVSNAGVFNIGSNQGTGNQTNIFSVDASSSTTTISNLSIGNLNFDTDAGMVALANIPLSSGPAAGTMNSQSILIGDTQVLTVYGENDGATTAPQNTRVSIGTSTTPWARLSVAGAGTGTGQLAEFFNSASTTVFRMLDNGTSYFSGNMGIGTTSPYGILSISNSATTAANTPLFNIASTTGGTSTSTLMTVLASGNVGIGTSTPANPLDIYSTSGVQLLSMASTGWLKLGIQGTANGTFSVFSTNANYGFDYSSQATGQVLLGPLGTYAIGSGGGATNPDINLSRGAAGKFYVGTGAQGSSAGTLVAGTIGVGTTTPWGKLAISLNNGETYGGNNAFIIASSTASATTTLFAIDNQGDVGIGTQPVVGLSIIASGQIRANVYSVNTGGAFIDQTRGQINFPADGVVQFRNAALTGFSGLKFGGTTSAFPAFSINTANQAIAVTPADGSLAAASFGIGTTSPFGAFGISLNSGANYTGNNAFIIASSTAGATSTLFSIDNAGNLTASVGAATFAGGVGVLTNGTLNLNSHIVSNVSSVFGSNSGGTNLTLATNNSTGNLIFQSATQVEGARLSSSGNFGIGSTTPFARLSVKGSDTSAATKGVIVTDSNNAELLTIFNNGITLIKNLLVSASSTIGDGTQAGGLTIFGGATTTKALVVQGTSASSTFAGNVEVLGGLKVGTGSVYLNGAATSTYTAGIQTSLLNVTSTTATSTFANGIQLTSGCILLPNGSCAGTGSGTSNASVTLTQTVTATTGTNVSWTAPANTAYIVVETWGAGGGGGGGGLSAASGGGGGTTCFGSNATACTSPSVSASGGTAGTGGGAGGNGGAGVNGDLLITGGGGGSDSMGFYGANSGAYGPGGVGGSAAGGGGGGGTSVFNGAGNPGSTYGGGGGGGGEANAGTGNLSGSGGGGGGYAKKVITSPTGTYYYTVGAGGSAGAAGTGGFAGAVGGAGGVTISVYTVANLSSSTTGVQLTNTVVKTTGSGTYTPPANIAYITVEMVGGGGGGAAGDTGYNLGHGGSAGSNTTFDTLTAGGGGGGTQSAIPASGGTASGGDVNFPGGIGGGSAIDTGSLSGMDGGNSAFGGGGGGGGDGQPGGVGATNTGAGGGGGGKNNGIGGGGGGAGGYVKKVITAPTGSYSYSVGAGGAAGTGGTGNVGGAGATGIIIIYEYTTTAAQAVGTVGQVAYLSGTNTVMGTSTLVIASNGNIGMGTTTPWAQLAVVPNGTSAPAFVVGSTTGTSLIVNSGAAPTVQTIYLTSGSSWSVPTDWNSTNNSIEVIGGGGGGGTGNVSFNGGSGGGGGAYSKITNQSLTPGGTMAYAIGTGGVGGLNGVRVSGVGGDTYFCNGSSNCASIGGTAVIVGAKGGGASAGAGTAGAAGGASASGVGSTKYSGGVGGDTNGVSAPRSGGGGGGAGGPNGIGGAGGSVTGGAGGGVDGGGGGGNGGGSAGGTVTTTCAFGTGGNNSSSAGGAAGAGTAGTVGGGGAGGEYAGCGAVVSTGGAGGPGAEWDATHGSGGGGGGGGGYAAGGAGGNYGAGGGGGASDGSAFTGGAGAQGIVVIRYTPVNTAGYVGIGTSAPTSLLMVNATGNGTVASYNNVAGNYSWNAYQVNGVNKGFMQWNVNDTGTAVGTAMILNNTQGKLHMWDSTNTGITVSGGFVGVGTTTPWANLAVTSPIQKDGSLSLFNVASTTGTSLFNILGNGNVGIGTTTPGSFITGTGGKWLDVTGTDPVLKLHNSSDPKKEVSILNHSSGLYIDSTGAATASNNQIVFRTNNTASSNGTGLITAMTINSAGNVGINNTNPQGILHTNMTANTDAAAPKFFSDAATVGQTSEIMIGQSMANYSAGMIRYTNGAGTAGSAVMQLFHYGDSASSGINILGGGKVGINTTSFPYNENLSISTANTQGIHIDESTGSNSVNYIYLTKQGTNVGAAFYNGATVAWQTTSDRRIKENIVPTTGGLDTLLKIPVYNFNYKSNPGHTVEGFVAQDLYPYFPQIVHATDDGVSALATTSEPWSIDYSGITPLLVQSIKDVNAKLEARTWGLISLGGDIAPLSATTSATELTTASSTVASSTPWVASFADASQGLKNGIFSIGQTIVHFIGRAVYATTGIFEKVFAKEVHTDKICVSDAAGETCLTRTQLDALIAGAVASQGSGGGSGASNNPPAPAATSSAPVISINGNNPTHIAIGTAYSDLGATITGPTTADTNLGIHTFLDGTEVSIVLLDTSAAGTHTIDYVATNATGAASSTRTVIIDAPVPPTPPTGDATSTTP